MAILWIFTTHSSAVAYLHKLIPLKHFTVGHSKYLGSLMVIQQHTHEKIANNRYELLFKIGDQSMLVHTNL